jgi:hypothetical protein
MLHEGQAMSKFAPPVSHQLLLDAIIQDPDCLETGLHLLETDPTPDKKACVASGFDRSGRPVVLCVMGDVIDVADVEAAMGCRRCPDVETIGRVIVLAAGFRDDWNCDPQTLSGGWELEPLRWHRQNENVDGEMVVEISDGEDEGGGDSAEAGMESLVPRLTNEEIGSLVGSGPGGSTGGRA